MKLLLLLILLTIAAYTIKAQALEEWTLQKQTQIKYLLQQIAALHVYAESTLKGYKIVKGGLATIEDIKDGDLHLHLDHISALKQVNPSVQGYAKVMIMRALQAAMAKQYTNTLIQLSQHKQLNKGECNYYQLVCNKLLQQGIDNLAVLMQLTSNDQLQMTDGERIKRIDDLYDDMLDKRAFLQSFSSEALRLDRQRSKDKEELETMRLMYSFK